VLKQEISTAPELSTNNNCMVEKALQIGLNSELQRIFLELVRITHILSLDLKVLRLV